MQQDGRSNGREAIFCGREPILSAGSTPHPQDVIHFIDYRVFQSGGLACL